MATVRSLHRFAEYTFTKQSFGSLELVAGRAARPHRHPQPVQADRGTLPGLLKRMVQRDGDGVLHRLTGAMAVVVQAGAIHVGDEIVVQLPPSPHQALQLV